MVYLHMRAKKSWVLQGSCAAVAIFVAQICQADTVYDAAGSFMQGYRLNQNPNGAWSYGFSNASGGAFSLFTDTASPGVNGPQARYFYSPSVDIRWSPTVEFNDGPAYADGNIDFLANQLVLVAGIGGQYSNLIFTAPHTAIYSLLASFRGDQHGIGTKVGIFEGSSLAFVAAVSAFGQVVPYSADNIALAAGQQIRIEVGPNGGLQNTGVDAIVTEKSALVAEPGSLMLIALAILAVKALSNRRGRTMRDLARNCNP